MSYVQGAPGAVGHPGPAGNTVSCSFLNPLGREQDGVMNFMMQPMRMLTHIITDYMGQVHYKSCWLIDMSLLLFIFQSKLIEKHICAVCYVAILLF